MIKRLIFDLDNTLITWKDEYTLALKKTVEHFNLNVNYIDVDNVISNYEDYYDKYTKEYLVELINKEFNLDINIDFINYWLKELENMADVDKELVDVLKYLSNKYELVVLTNWFKESQLKRLEHVNILKYFKEIYGGDEFIKPSKESFIKAKGDYDFNECIMIGDSYRIDIEPAIKLGIKTIMISKEKKDDTVTIKNICELKEML